MIDLHCWLCYVIDDAGGADADDAGATSTVMTKKQLGDDLLLECMTRDYDVGSVAVDDNGDAGEDAEATKCYAHCDL